jgi:hypothetical protein
MHRYRLFSGIQALVGIFVSNHNENAPKPKPKLNVTTAADPPASRFIA